MAGTLSDQAWAEICEAARLTPDEEARAALTALLFEAAPAFAYDSERMEADLGRSKRMLNRLNTFAADYCAQFTSDDVKTEADLWCLRMLQQRPRAAWLAARAIRRANKGKMDTQREWLVHRLCTIWLDHFNGPGLTLRRGGPLIQFLLAALRQILPEEALPRPETVRDGIKRERAERAVTAKRYERARNKPGGPTPE